MGILPLTNRVLLNPFSILRSQKLQIGRHASDDGGELTDNLTMAGRIFKIIATKSHHEYVIIEAFNVSGSRDDRYGMPTMHVSPDYGYQTILPSVSHDFSLLGLILTTVRTFCSSSMPNMTVKVESVSTQPTVPTLRTVERQQPGKREQCDIPHCMTDFSSIFTHFTMRGAFVRFCPET